MLQRPCKSIFLVPPITPLPGYPVPVTHSRISAYQISLCYSIRSSKKPNIFYSKLFRKVCISLGNSRAAGGFELDSNRARAAVNLRFFEAYSLLGRSCHRLSSVISCPRVSQSSLNSFAFHRIIPGKNEINPCNS